MITDQCYFICIPNRDLVWSGLVWSGLVWCGLVWYWRTRKNPLWNLSGLTVLIELMGIQAVTADIGRCDGRVHVRPTETAAAVDRDRRALTAIVAVWWGRRVIRMQIVRLRRAGFRAEIQQLINLGGLAVVLMTVAVVVMLLVKVVMVVDEILPGRSGHRQRRRRRRTHRLVLVQICRSHSESLSAGVYGVERRKEKQHKWTPLATLHHKTTRNRPLPINIK